MSAKNLMIDGWDLTEAVLASAEAFKDSAQQDTGGSKPDAPKKLSRQERALLHLSLVEAVRQGDATKVRALLAQGAEIELLKNKAGEDVMRIALEHFDRAVFDELIGHGGKISYYHLNMHAGKKSEVVRYLIETYDRWSQQGDGARKIGERHGVGADKLVPAEFVFQSIYEMLLCHRLREDEGENMGACAVIDQHFPNLLGKILKKLYSDGKKEKVSLIEASYPMRTLCDVFLNFLTSDNDSQVDKFALQKPHENFWPDLMTCFLYQLDRNFHLNDFNETHLQNLHRLMARHEGLREEFLTAGGSMKDKHQAFVDYYDAPNSPIHSWVKTHPKIKHYHLQGSIGRALDLIQKPDVELGWTSMRLRFLTINVDPGDWAIWAMDERIDANCHDGPTWTHFKSLPKPPLSYSKNFTSILVRRGFSCLRTLCKTTGGRQAILAAMNDPGVAYEFACRSDLSVFNHVVRAIPELVAWRDDFGNSLAHYRLSAKSVNKTTAETLARIDTDWVMSANAVGKTGRDFAVKSMGEKSVGVSEMDKILIKKSIKLDDQVGRKMRGRNTEQKRRM